MRVYEIYSNQRERISGFSLFAWFAPLKQNAFSECQLWSRLCKEGPPDKLLPRKGGSGSGICLQLHIWEEVLSVIKWCACGSARGVPVLLWTSHLVCCFTLQLYYSNWFFYSHLIFFLSKFSFFQVLYPSIYPSLLTSHILHESVTGSSELCSLTSFLSSRILLFLVVSCSGFVFSFFPSSVSSLHLHFAWTLYQVI